LLVPVKEGARMVSDLLQELHFLPCTQWKEHVATFNRRLDKLAEAAVSLVSRADATKDQLKKVLAVDERELAIVVARAEKIRPGIFLYIFANYK